MSARPPVPSAPAAELDEVLRKVSFLKEEPPELRAQLAQLAICHYYPKGNILYYNGDTSTAVYVVLHGRVKISLMNEEGREVILAVMASGDVFGLVEALDGGAHPATAITLSDCRLAKMPSDRFLGWLRQHPALHEQVVIRLAQMVRDAYGKVGEQALLSVKRRLFTTLLEIARSDGKPRGQDVVFERPTHQELADRVGSSRVVISRIFKELIEEERDLSMHGRVIRVPLSALVPRDEF